MVVVLNLLSKSCEITLKLLPGCESKPLSDWSLDVVLASFLDCYLSISVTEADVNPPPNCLPISGTSLVEAFLNYYSSKVLECINGKSIDPLQAENPPSNSFSI